MPVALKPRTTKALDAKTEYYSWLEQEVEAAINDPRPRIPHAKVIERLDAEMKLLKKRHLTCMQKI